GGGGGAQQIRIDPVDGQRVAAGTRVEVDRNDERAFGETGGGGGGRAGIFDPATLRQLHLIERDDRVQVLGLDLLRDAFGVGKTGLLIEDRRAGRARECRGQRVWYAELGAAC